MSSISLDLNNVRKSLINSRFNREVDELRQKQNKTEDDLQNIKLLDQLLAKNIVKPYETAEQKLDNKFKEVEKIMYTRPWIKLTVFHKTVKLQEYVDNTYEKESRSDIMKLLTTALDEKTLRPKDISYDQKNGKIIQITNIKKNTSGKYYI